MADTFTQVYLQYVFAVKGRYNFIPRSKKEELHKYITGLVQNKKCKLLAVNCMPDHTHLFVGFNPTIAISELIKSVKIATNDFINDKKWLRENFQWQNGYGVFSYGHSQIDRVIQYVNNQEIHHAKKNFREEYQTLLKRFSVEYSNTRLFEFCE